MTNPLDVIGLQMKIIQDGIAKVEEETEGKDEEKEERLFETERIIESEREFFPEPIMYGEGEGRGSDWDR